MKRFILFAGSVYYPQGGWEDYVGSCNQPIEALLALAAQYWDSWMQEYDCSFCWWQIVDTHTRQIILEKEYYTT